MRQDEIGKNIHSARRQHVECSQVIHFCGVKFLSEPLELRSWPPDGHGLSERALQWRAADRRDVIVDSPTAIGDRLLRVASGNSSTAALDALPSSRKSPKHRLSPAKVAASNLSLAGNTTLSVHWAVAKGRPRPKADAQHNLTAYCEIV